ncbi:MAG: hypothetical protein ABS46_00740 [Cytophagaceae bacterium SCN 52-12]|nr:MAG: hypothetical protein ABS46_00740 [Cytophagaceae bacterium SCN 52-12]
MNDLTRKSIFEPDIIPARYEGRALAAQSSRVFLDADTAKIAYSRARERLLDVNRWTARIRDTAAVFQLTDREGKPVEGKARKGLMIKVDFLGAGISAGYGRGIIDDLEEGFTEKLDFMDFKVRPVENPSGKESNIAYFFPLGSSGIFVLYRKKNEVVCTVYDRHLKPNVEVKDNLSDRPENPFAGAAATTATGMPGIQWQKLADSVLEAV